MKDFVDQDDQQGCREGENEHEDWGLQAIQEQKQQKRQAAKTTKAKSNTKLSKKS